MQAYKSAAKAWAAEAVKNGSRIDRLERVLRKIDENAKFGQDGSCNYAMDRLAQIRILVATVLDG